jgi:competence protein ComEC
MPWLPVAFGSGIVLYFTADREPVMAVALAAAALFILAAFLARRRPIGLPAMLGVAAVATGFAVATLKSTHVAHPILSAPLWNVSIAGWVEIKEERERTDRIVVRVHQIEGNRLRERLERVRVSVRKGTAPAVGTFIAFHARLNPPLQPLRPGGYDFARDLYFRGIGATGFVLGSIKLAQSPSEPSFWLRFAAAIQATRDGIDRRIRTIIHGDAGAIASALITGKRDAISAPVNDAMYISSLAHVLSISGYHMAVVAGVVFFAIRAGLALAPALALRRPIKKWAALGALLSAAFYLVLSGAEIATQRAFIMITIVLIGVMADRPALTLRTLALAALAVMFLSPDAVVHPSFQMSFAATLALIAAYERGLPWATAGADTSLGARLALWGGRELLALILASIVAGLATMPYAAYHFHRLAPYGVVANLLAMPIVSIVVMPAGLLALLALPFGFDASFWQLMGKGIEWMITVAVWVSQLPGAVGRMSAFGPGALLVATAGLVLICLLRTPLRWSGAAVLALGVGLAVMTTQPDILVSQDARAVAVRNASGRFSLIPTAKDQFAIRAWLAADGDGRDPADSTLHEGWICDEIGCMARLKDGAIVAAPSALEAFDEDCRRAAIVVSARPAPAGCRAMVIDRDTSRRLGALGVTRGADGFAITAARPAGHERPWNRLSAEAAAGDWTAGRRRPTAPSATPPMEYPGPDD